jgi:hypothetical protein
VPFVSLVDGGAARRPGADEVGPHADQALGEEGAPVVPDDVDGLADLLDFGDQPGEVLLLGAAEAGWRVAAEARHVEGDRVPAREAGADAVPEVVRFRDAVYEYCWHAMFSF